MKKCHLWSDYKVRTGHWYWVLHAALPMTPGTHAAGRQGASFFLSCFSFYSMLQSSTHKLLSGQSLIVVVHTTRTVMFCSSALVWTLFIGTNETVVVVVVVVVVVLIVENWHSWKTHQDANVAKKKRRRRRLISSSIHCRVVVFADGSSRHHYHHCQLAHTHTHRRRTDEDNSRVGNFLECNVVCPYYYSFARGDGSSGGGGGGGGRHSGSLPVVWKWGNEKVISASTRLSLWWRRCHCFYWL